MNRFSMEYLDHLEQEFTLNDSNGVKNSSFKTVLGSSPILLSCPHSVNQFRNGKLKEREKYSGALAKLLQQLTDTHLIYKSFNDGLDDNYDYHTPYKKEIGKIIKENKIDLVIDIHGMVSSYEPLFRGYHIEIGTNNLKNLLDKPHIRDLSLNKFKEYGIVPVVADQFFKASRPYTISKYVADNYSTSAFQIEITSDYRNPTNSIEKFNLLIEAFENLICEIDNFYI